MEEQYVQGTPSFVLMPAKNYTFKVSKEHYSITIPKSGKYVDIAPEIFTEEDGEFDILANDTLYLPSVTKVLFATRKYPDLAFNQFFAPYLIEVDDSGDITIIGQVLDMMLVKTEGESNGESE